MFRFTIRELVLLTLIVAMGVGWWVDHLRLVEAMRVSTIAWQAREAVLEAENSMLRLGEHDLSYEIMRRLVSNAELAILGEIESVGDGMSHEGGSHVSMECRIKVIDLIQGKSPTGNTILAYIDILSDHPAFPSKGDRRVFLLRPNSRDNPQHYSTNDIRFSIQPATMASELKRQASEMAAQQNQKPSP